MASNTSWIPFDLLEAFMVDVFKGVGVPVHQRLRHIYCVAWKDRRVCPRGDTLSGRTGNR